MQINSSNYSFNFNKQTVKNPNFEGLWGKTSRNTDFDVVLGIPKIEETSYYYPFADETKEEINKIVTENTRADIEGSSGTIKYKINDCRICTTLPFKKVDFDNYTSINEKSDINSNMKTVHYLVLDKYINNGYGAEQTSALNEKVAQKLDIKS